ncbi:hypothetical protein GGI42DRAFT_46621 [Trichoderma sp. SZMC 28013]
MIFHNIQHGRFLFFSSFPFSSLALSKGNKGHRNMKNMIMKHWHHTPSYITCSITASPSICTCTLYTHFCDIETCTNKYTYIHTYMYILYKVAYYYQVLKIEASRYISSLCVMMMYEFVYAYILYALLVNILS